MLRRGRRYWRALPVAVGGAWYVQLDEVIIAGVVQDWAVAGGKFAVDVAPVGSIPRVLGPYDSLEDASGAAVELSAVKP